MRFGSVRQGCELDNVVRPNGLPDDGDGFIFGRQYFIGIVSVIGDVCAGRVHVPFHCADASFHSLFLHNLGHIHSSACRLRC